MTMERFTPAYKKTQESVKSYRYDAAWRSFLTDKACVRLIVSSNEGPSHTHGTALDKLRKKMAEASGKTDGQLILDMIGVNPSGTQALTAEQAKAAAALKLLRHFYLQDKAGAQSVWIFAQPKSYTKWVFDEISGSTASAAKTKLDKVDEVYSKEIRKHMGDGINQAKNWASKCVAKLGTPDDATKNKIKEWFIATDTNDEKLKKVTAKLLAGFKAISQSLGSNKVIFSDEPIDRNAGGWKDYAFADPSETMMVVYIQKATLDKWSSASEKWMATLAVVHEISHKVAATDDAVYDSEGLKPGGVLTAKHAVNNADSWAYFAADLNGCLTEAKRSSCYKVPGGFDSDYEAGNAPAL